MCNPPNAGVEVRTTPNGRTGEGGVSPKGGGQAS